MKPIIKIQPTIKNKLLIGFTAVPSIGLVIGLVGWFGAFRLNSFIGHTGEISLPSLQAILSIKEAQTTIKASLKTLLNPTLNSEDRNLEYNNIHEAFNTTKKATQDYQYKINNTKWDNFLTNWQQFEQEIENFILISKKIDALQINNPQQLALNLELNFSDYKTWAIGTVSAILNHYPFTGNINPEKSPFIIWLSSLEIKNKETSQEKENLYRQIMKTYSAVSNIAEYLEIEEYELANDEYTVEVLPSIQNIQNYVNVFIKPINESIFLYQELTTTEKKISSGSMRNTVNYLDILINDTKEKVTSNVSNGKRLAYTVILIILLTIIVGVAGAMWAGVRISRTIVEPIQKMMEAISKLSQGDTSVFLPVGHVSNCSSLKQCGQKQCPSFGKTEACWVISGSFAAIKSCPRAKKGEDCRTCHIYGEKTEMEELGSIIMRWLILLKKGNNLPWQLPKEISMKQ
jgi:methyl-accepting chemotaxis protein